MEQTFARTRNIVRDTADTENLTDRELLARELDSARIAAARAYGLERMGIGGDQPELKQYYKQLSLQYIHDSLQDELATIDDQTQRNALAIGSTIEESVRLGEMIDAYTESNIVYRGLRGLDTMLERGSRKWVRTKRMGMSVVAALVGKSLGGIPGGMLAAAASAGIQEVAKIEYDSVGQPIDEQLELAGEMSSRTDVDTSTLMAEAQHRSIGHVEQHVARDRAMTYERAKVGLKRAGTAAALAGVAGLLMTSFSTPAHASGIDTTPVDTGAGHVPSGSIDVESTHVSLGDVSTDGSQSHQVVGSIDTSEVVRQPGILSVDSIESHHTSGLVDTTTVDVHAPSNGIDTDTTHTASPSHMDTTPAHTSPGEVATDTDHGSSGKVVTDGDHAPAGAIEISSTHTATGAIDTTDVNGTDLSQPTPDAQVEVDNQLPSVDKGEGLDKFVGENYDFELSHDQSMALGEKLHETGFMYEDGDYLGDKFGNQYGINLPGEINLETHETIGDMVDDGQLNGSNLSVPEIDVSHTVDVDTSHSVATDSATAQADLTGTDDVRLYTPDNSVELPVSLSDAKQWIDSGHLQNFYRVLGQERMADIAQYLDQRDITYGDIDNTGVIVKDTFTGNYIFNHTPDNGALPSSVKLALHEYFSQANFRLAS